mgnify:CR=1 FL=1
MSNIVRPISLYACYCISNTEAGLEGSAEEEVEEMSSLQILAKSMDAQRHIEARMVRCPENYCAHEDRVRN